MAVDLEQDPKGSGYLVFSNNKNNYYHRWVAEKKYGKEAIRDKHIHHIDGIRTHNDPTNLVALEKRDHYHIEQYRNKIKLLSDIVLFLLVCSFFILFFSIFIKELSLLASMLIMVAIALILEIRSGLFKQMILSPKKDIYPINP